MAGKNNANKQPTAAELEAKAAAEGAIFGGADTPAPSADPMGVVQPAAPEAPQAPTHKGIGVPQEDTVTISRVQLEAIMGRLSDLESVAITSERNSDASNIFNPLAEVKEDRILNVVFYGDKDEMLVGYKEKVRIDGRKTYTWLEKNPQTGEVRTMATLLLLDLKTDEVREETVDFVMFHEAAIPLPATIKDRKDIGEIKEHGLVAQMTWNGKALVPTDQKVMTGCKEQHFLFTVDFRGKRIQLPENVVNIK
jgi:hypothetical protein